MRQVLGRAIVAAGLLGMMAQAAPAAEEWGIEGEKTARFAAKVVDVLCVITGDCPKDCGAGRRQLGLLTDEGKLYPAVKNFVPFAGAQVELKPFCGKRVLADGLIIESPKARLFALQFVKPLPDGKWRRANRFGMAWSKANGGKDASEWYRHDPLVKKIIEKDGKLGLGAKK